MAEIAAPMSRAHGQSLARLCTRPATVEQPDLSIAKILHVVAKESHRNRAPAAEIEGAAEDHGVVLGDRADVFHLADGDLVAASAQFGADGFGDFRGRVALGRVGDEYVS
jgi:hypothetical protein